MLVLILYWNKASLYWLKKQARGTKFGEQEQTLSCLFLFKYMLHTAISFYWVIPLDKNNSPHTGLFKWNSAKKGSPEQHKKEQFEYNLMREREREVDLLFHLLMHFGCFL